jgi:hypothetical protein
VTEFAYVHRDGTESKLSAGGIAEQSRSQMRTLANLNKVPRELVDALKALLKGGAMIGTG